MPRPVPPVPPVALALLMVFAALAAGPAAADAPDPPPHPNDPQWVAMPAPWFDAAPAALTDDAGHLVLAGPFHALGAQRLRHVAEWNGTQFDDLGSPDLPLVHAATTWNGALVVGGAGASPSTGAIAHRNGTQWETIATTNGDVTALATWNGDLVAAGTFTIIGGVSANRVARFDGTAWHALGGGFNNAGATVNALLAFGTDLYAGGNFGLQFSGIARWDGTTWSAPGGGLNGTVTSLTTNGVWLYAGGPFTATSGDSLPGVAAWTGVGWRRVSHGVFPVRSVAWWNGALYADIRDGTSRISRLASTFWAGTGDGLTGAPTQLAVVGGKLIAVGPFGGAAGGGDVANVHQYDGVSWTALGSAPTAGMSGLDGTTYDAIVANDRLAVVGIQKFASGAATLAVNGTAAWDGTSWTSLGNGVGGYPLRVRTFGTDLIATGELGLPGESIARIGRWNGTGWSVFGNDYSVIAYDAAAHQGSLYAAGAIQLGSSHNVARWNGTAWEGLGVGVGIVVELAAAVTSWNGSLVVGGLFSTAGGAPALNIASWNGTRWSPLAGGVDGEPYALATLGPDLVVGGDITRADGQPATGAARWDGSAWHAMGTRAIEVRDFAQIDGVLYGAGRFRNAAGEVHPTVARWSGTEWDLMGSGVPDDNSILWVEGYHGDLYAGGYFTSAFGKATSCITRLPAANSLTVGDAAPRAVVLAASPNPGRRSTTFAFSLPVRGHVRLAVYDPAGREVARVLDGDVLAGTHEVRWTASARPGVYFARLEAASGASRVTRVVRLE